MSPFSVRNVTCILGKNNLSFRGYLQWINDSLGTQYTRLEELSTGSAYCKLLYQICPQSINLRNIKEESYDESFHKRNLHLFRDALHELGAVIDIKAGSAQGDITDIDVEKLSTACCYPAHFKFLQWFKMFYDANRPATGEVKTNDVKDTRRSRATLKMVPRTTRPQRMEAENFPKTTKQAKVERQRVIEHKIEENDENQSNDKVSVLENVVLKQVHAKKEIRTMENEPNTRRMDLCETNEAITYMKEKFEEIMKIGQGYQSVMIDTTESSCYRLIKSAKIACSELSRETEGVAAQMGKTLESLNESMKEVSFAAKQMSDSADKLVDVIAYLAQHQLSTENRNYESEPFLSFQPNYTRV